MKTLFITGGAGFIGVNSADHFAQRGWRIVVIDNLSSPGAEDNIRWLQQAHDGVRFERADVRDAATMERLVGEVQPEALLHLAAQVAVTTSVADPRLDFEVNALGTFNLLEAVRRRSPQSSFIHASTNKVYGKMDDLEVMQRDGGGPANALSLLALVAMLEERLGKCIPLQFADWRPGDQPVFVCNVGKARELLEWAPEIGARDGVSRLIEWVGQNRGLFAQ